MESDTPAVREVSIIGIYHYEEDKPPLPLDGPRSAEGRRSVWVCTGHVDDSDEYAVLEQRGFHIIGPTGNCEADVVEQGLMRLLSRLGYAVSHLQWGDE